MKKVLVCLGVLGLSLSVTPFVWAHGDVTPAQVITDMKAKQKGPYAAPMFRGKTLSGDWLGVTLEDFEHGGVQIRKVVEDGLGDDAGLEQFDVIREVDGNQIKNQKDLDAYLAKIKEPKELTFTLWRDGKRKEKTVYLVPNLGEIAPEMADMFEGKTRPQPGMMMDKMIAQTPMGKNNGQGKSLHPGMFAEDMMQRSPMGQHNRGEITIKSNDPIDNFIIAKQREIAFLINFQKDLGLTDEQISALKNLDLEFQKQAIAIDAGLKIIKLELGQLLEQADADVEKLETVLKNLYDLQQKKQQQVLDMLRKYNELISKEKRQKLLELLKK
ncbi:MAG: PDZ domain-containing protein [Candidatus Schekmanbacteria bacterium]|nr:PDZ domain-containing protein [Candidatus Schekmanbacteria bacterium]